MIYICYLDRPTAEQQPVSHEENGGSEVNGRRFDDGKHLST